MKSTEPTPHYAQYKKRSWVAKNWTALLTILLGLIAINLIFLSKAFRGDEIDPQLASNLGGFVGGYIGTLFSLVGVMFLYLTLKDQRESSEIEKFTTKYFELLKFHRDNVQEVLMGEESGKKVFVNLIREFREALSQVKDIAARHNLHHSPQQLIEIAYYILFIGVGPNSSRMLKIALKNFNTPFVDNLEDTLNQTVLKEEIKKKRQFKYLPFEGHQSRLGHYYRHLYQTVKFVDAQNIDIDKYDYVKTIRAQLTTHEQALLFLNSFSSMGKKWREEHLLLKYKMVKNIPPHFFDINNEIDITAFFPHDYFEWQE